MGTRAKYLLSVGLWLVFSGLAWGQEPPSEQPVKLNEEDLGFFSGLFQRLFNFLTSLVKAGLRDLFNGLKNVFLWVVQQLQNVANGLWELVLGALPVHDGVETTGVIAYARAANEWLPLDLCVSLFTSLVTLWLALAGYRWVKRHIPFFGGA